VASLVHSETEYSVARLENGGDDDLVGGGPGVWLDVGVLGGEGLFCPGDGEAFQVINDLAATVISGADEALGGLVLNDRAEHGQDRPGALVLRGDELDAVGEALVFPCEQLVDVEVMPAKVVEEVAVVLFAGSDFSSRVIVGRRVAVVRLIRFNGLQAGLPGRVGVMFIH
jgi:hypothetical protein